MKIYFQLPAWLAAMLLGACSAGMEAHRPVPVNLSQFKPGENRLDVVSVVGAPEGQIIQPAGPCDVYGLYTTGVGGFGKGVITAGEVLTDVATLGVAEIIWTPVQAGTQPKKHTVLFCYDHNEKLIGMTNKKREG